MVLLLNWVHVLRLFALYFAPICYQECSVSQLLSFIALFKFIVFGATIAYYSLLETVIMDVLTLYDDKLA